MFGVSGSPGAPGWAADRGTLQWGGRRCRTVSMGGGAGVTADALKMLLWVVVVVLMVLLRNAGDGPGRP